MPMDIYTLPHEVLTSCIAPFLQNVDCNTFLASCKVWLPCLLSTRTITLRGDSWCRFCEDGEYRAQILKLVGCIDPITKQEVVKRKLKLDLSYFESYWYDQLYFTTVSVARKYQDFFAEVLTGFDTTAEQIVKAFPSIPRCYALVRCELLVHQWHCLRDAIITTDNAISNLSAITQQCKGNKNKTEEIETSQQPPNLQSLQNLLHGIESIRFFQGQCLLKVNHCMHSLQSVHLDTINIEDLTPLYGVKIVSLSNADHIRDISPLTKAQKVELVHCPLITDFTPLTSVPAVELKILAQLQDVSIFANGCTTHLTLHLCQNIVDISMLGHIQVLEVVCCTGVRQYPKPAGRQQRWTFKQQDLADLTGFENLHTLVLFASVNITNISPLAELHTLHIHRCHNMLDVSTLRTVKMLTLSHCARVADVSMLGDVEVLSLDGCDSIESIDGLRNVYGKGIPEKLRSGDAKWFFPST